MDDKGQSIDINDRHFCELCGKTFNHKQNLNSHHKKVHLELKVKCDVCEKTFSSNQALNNHYDNIHKGLSWDCDLCEKSFKSKTWLKTHKDSVHEGQRYDCSECGQSYKTKSTLLNHMYCIHKREDGAWKCDMCHKTFSNPVYLNVHKRTVHKETKYTCTICSKAFNQLKGLTTHNENVHSGQVFQCDLCDTSCNSESNLVTHKKNYHYSTKSWECQYQSCNFISKSERGLRSHNDSVHLKKMKKCKHCGEDFKLGSLAGHVKRYHTTEKYDCDICGQSFHSKSHLKKHHERIHLQLKVQCEYCKKDFPKDGLQKHIKVVHFKIKNLNCEHCDVRLLKFSFHLPIYVIKI